MKRTLSLLTATLAAATLRAEPAAEITVVSWGGAYEQAQRASLFRPFTEATGIEVNVARYDGGIAELRRQHARGDVSWDVIDMTMSDTLAACQEGLLQPLSPGILRPAPDGTPARADFMPGSFTRCGIAHTVYATVVAYDRRAFPKARPTQVEDLFDTERFPGPRALQRAPFGNLEWALLSYGVPREEIYNLLSTERGLRLALRRLDGVAPDAFWWEHGDRPAKLLVEGKAVMATGYNGRFFHVMATTGAPIEIIWDGQLQEYENWVIPRGAPHTEAARRFLRFATTAERLADFARHLPYGPTRRSALGRVTTHVTSGLHMRPQLPTHPYNARSAITKDVRWYAEIYDGIRGRFNTWLRAYVSSAAADDRPVEADVP